MEDESAVARLLTLVLCGPKCEVRAATDGVAALAKIAAVAQPFDVIITDHDARMTGIGLVRRLRAQKFAGKIVVLSAFLDEASTRSYKGSESIFSWSSLSTWMSSGIRSRS
ncbi:MAG: response regulator [Chthoniobacterales bacterium]